MSAQFGEWQDIATAPNGYDGTKFNYVLFRGYSKARSFNHAVEVSGYMGHDNNGKRVPVHFYAYKLVITHWMPLPPPPTKGETKL